MKKRWITCTLLLLAFVMLLGSCTKEEPTGTTNTPPAGNEVATSAYQDEVVTVDMGHREFVMMSQETYNQYNFFYGEDYTGDPINDTAYERISYIEGRYNVAFEYKEVPAPAEALENESASDKSAFDLLYPHPTTSMGKLLNNGLLTNLKTLEHLNLDRPWYAQSQVTNYEKNGYLLLATSDYSIVGQGIGGILFNRDFYTNLGNETDLYDMVYGGNWTLENMGNIIKNAGTDTAGTGEREGYGFIMRQTAANGFATASGQNILVKNAEGDFALGFTTSMMSDIADAVNDMLITGGENVLTKDIRSNAEFMASAEWELYKQGKSLFITFDFGQLQSLLRDLSFDIGFLPYPTMTSTTDYRIRCGGGFFAIPAKAQSIEQSSIILESLSIYSYEYMRPEFFETILLGRLSENKADFDMLSYLQDHKYWDFGFTFDTKNVANYMLFNILFTYGDVRAVTTYWKGHKGEIEQIVTDANAFGLWG